MTARAAYSRVGILGGAASTALESGITSSGLSLTIGAGEASSWSGLTTNGRALVVIDRGGDHEEKAWVSGVSGQTVTVADTADRGVDGTSAQAHDAGESVEVIIGAVHIDEASKAVAEVLGKATTAGQMLYVSGAQVLTALGIGASGRVLISSGSAPTWQALAGDVTVNASGVTVIGNDKIDSQHYVDGSIDLAHMSANSVDSDQYVDGSIDTAHLGDDQVTLAKLAAAAKPRWCVPFTGANAHLFSSTVLGWGDSANEVPYVAPEAGAIVGVSVAHGTARSAGSCTYEVRKNGSGIGLTVTIDDSPTQYGYATQAESGDTFVAGDRIDVVATASSLNSTSDVGVAVHLQAV